jgi:hypothetical protein
MSRRARFRKPFLPATMRSWASSGDAIMLALVADGQACGRFPAPEFIKTMLTQVGERETVLLGTPL